MSLDRLLLVSDIHSRIANLEEIVRRERFDVLLIAGDLTHLKTSDILKIDEVLSREGVESYAVYGNCDYEEITKLDLDSINFIHGKSEKIGDITIHGLSGSLPTPFKTPSEYPEEYYAEILKRFKLSNFNILLSHTPPKGILDKAKHGENVGSEEIRKRLKDFNVVVAGHVHESSGIHRDLTLVVNPGPVLWGMFAVLELSNMYVELKKI